ncbi:MAG: MerR family transcriptional regulator [Deltaproteobacteria bacterium]|jgi:DNA-binding transcriptional MerR regulator/effector-binding domain-containing protein|nr:MerR family transcriptional regulator [Deltaproteobacteria bacterium]
MFKIGDFSKLGQVSTRMLRHYDKIGLLIPNEVDQWTGYRYYSVEQLAQLHRIIAMKDLGLGLQQVSELIKEDETIPVEQLRGMLKLKHAEIEQDFAANKTRLANVAARLQQIEQQDQPCPYEIVVKSVPAQTIASIRQVVSKASEMGHYCESLYQQLYQGLKQHKIKPVQPEIAMYHNKEYSETDLDIEMSVIVDNEYIDHKAINDKIIFRELPPLESAAALIYKGPFSEMSAAIIALLTWTGTHQYVPAPPLREIRLSGPAHMDGKLQKEPVLELQVPVYNLSTKD